MLANTALQPLPYTQAEYKHFETIYDGFCYIYDHKNDPIISIYAFKQTEVHENLVEFWPTIMVMCQTLNIPLTVTLLDSHEFTLGYFLANPLVFACFLLFSN